MFDRKALVRWLIDPEPSVGRYVDPERLLRRYVDPELIVIHVVVVVDVEINYIIMLAWHRYLY